MEKSPEIKFKQIGRNLNVIIGETVYTKTGSKEALQPFKDMITEYNAKRTKKGLAAVVKALTPEATAKEEVKEQIIVETKAAVKAAKRAVKAEKIEKKAKSSEVADLAKEIRDGKVSEEDIALLKSLFAESNIFFRNFTISNLFS